MALGVEHPLVSAEINAWSLNRKQSAISCHRLPSVAIDLLCIFGTGTVRRHWKTLGGRTVSFPCFWDSFTVYCPISSSHLILIWLFRHFCFTVARERWGKETGKKGKEYFPHESCTGASGKRGELTLGVDSHRFSARRLLIANWFVSCWCRCCCCCCCCCRWIQSLVSIFLYLFTSLI